MRQGILLRLLLTLALAIPTFAAAHAQSVLPAQWQSTHGVENPLVGHIFSGAGVLASEPDLTAAGKGAEFVMLGESHDNPDHHIIQANILQALVASGRRPALVWEMVPKRLPIRSTDMTSRVRRWTTTRGAWNGKNAAGILGTFTVRLHSPLPVTVWPWWPAISTAPPPAPFQKGALKYFAFNLRPILRPL